MSHTPLSKIQNKLSELEKFIGDLLERPMNPEIKKKVLDELHNYKAKLISNGDKKSQKPSDKNSSDDSGN